MKEDGMDLKDKVVVITGASQGIGLEIARELLSQSAKVALCSRSITEKWKSLDIDNPSALPVCMNVCDPASVAKGIDAILERFGRIDVLVNNAGFNGTVDRWENLPDSIDHEIIDTHFFGALTMIRASLPSLKRNGGTIVNIASVVGWVPMPGASIYSAAKAAVIAFSKGLRGELKEQKIDIRIFAPAHTNTGFDIQRPSRETPASVASSFVHFLAKDRQCLISDAFLPWLGRWIPSLAQRLMNSTGEKAMVASMDCKAEISMQA